MRTLRESAQQCGEDAVNFRNSYRQACGMLMCVGIGLGFTAGFFPLGPNILILMMSACAFAFARIVYGMSNEAYSKFMRFREDCLHDAFHFEPR